MIGQDVTGNVTLVGFVEWKYTLGCHYEKESVTIDGGDELGFLVFRKVEIQFDFLCQRQAVPMSTSPSKQPTTTPSKQPSTSPSKQTTSTSSKQPSTLPT